METLNKSLNWISRLSWTHILLTGVALTGGYIFWGNYQEQFYAFLPYLILLLCPLMHIFLHRGHGGQNIHKHQAKKTIDSKDTHR
jgi:hypothetical protein